MPRLIRSIRAQIVLWNMLALALLFLALGAVVRQVVRAAVYGSIEREMFNRIHPLLDGPPQFGQRFDDGHGQGGPDSSHWPDHPDGEHDQQGVANNHEGSSGGPMTFMAPPPRRGPVPERIFDMSGQPLGPDHSYVPWDQRAMALAQDGGLHYTTVAAPDGDYRVLTSRFPARPPFRGIIQVAYPLWDVERTMGGLDISLLVLAPLGLLVAAVGGWFLSDRMLVRLRGLAAAAGRIGGGDFARRLPVEGGDEFADLGRTMNSMLARLESAYRDLEQSAELQRRFVADASHELKTPLTTIKANAQLALSKPKAGGDRQSLEEIARAAKDMDRLVQDLLLLARSDSGKLGGDRIELLLVDVLEGAAERTKGAGLAAVELDVQDGSLVVRGNEGELLRLFSNLIENARRFSPSDRPVRVVARAGDGWIETSVIDEGQGIAPEHLPHLGERFYRVDDSRARSDGGSGLGLSICLGIAEAHGGSISFESEAGKGTTVRVRLPYLADA
jgi:signal transduction histidine kinase